MDRDIKVMNIKNIVAIVLFIAVVIALGTYAWLSYRSKNTAMVLTVGDINNMQITLSPYQLDLSLTPMLSYASLDTSGKYVTVTVTNNSTSTKNFSLYYDISEIDSGLKNSNFKYTIVRTNDNNTTEGNFASANTTTDFYILNGSIAKNTTYTYKIYVWLYGNTSNVPGLTFKGDLRAVIPSS